MSRLEIACLLTATAVHGAVLSLTYLAPESRLVRALADHERPIPQEIDIEILPDEPSRILAPDEPLAGALVARSLPRSDRPAHAGLDPRLGEPLLAPEDLEGDAATSEPAWSLPPAAEAYGDAPGGGPLPGLPGVPLWAHGIGSDAAGPAPAPTTVEKREIDRQAATKILTAAQKSRDKELGLDLPAAGTIASAVGAGVRASALPPVCRGVLAVSLGPDGRVKGAKVVAGNGGASSDWAAVASFVLSRLAGQTFAMPGAYARGAMVMVTVSSSMRLPSGTQTGPGAPSGSIGTSGTFDLADIGADASRVVTTRFTTAPLE